MSTVLSRNIPDIIRVEGINFLGSGPAAKLVALDTSISLEAKAIYALICSYSGSGNTQFPCVKNIQRMLGLGNRTYYKHLGMLIAHGYLKVEQQFDETRFARNIYTIITNPACLKEIGERECDHDSVYASGIFSKGFGIISKAVMADARLSCKAKGLYFFYCTFTGAGSCAMPKREEVAHFLGISINSLTKYKKELLELNYIEDKQRISGNKFSGSDTIIVMSPKGYPTEQTTHFVCKSVDKKSTKNFESSEKPVDKGFLTCTKNCTTGNDETENIVENSVENYVENSTCTKNCTTEDFTCTKFTCTKNCTTRNTDIRNISITENSFTQYNNIITGKEERQEILEKVTLLTNWYRTDEDNKSINLFNEALTDMLFSREGTLVMKENISARDVVYKLNLLIEKNEESEDHFSFILYDLLVNSLIDYEHGCKISNVNNHLKYMQACIWTCMKLNNSRLIETLSYKL